MSFTCQNLTVGYDAKPILHDFSYAFRPAQFTALLGANGCGKSTLLKSLAGQLTSQPDSILLDETPLHAWSLPERAKRVAYLPQYPELYSDMTVFDLVRYGRFPHQSLRQQWQPEDEQAVAEALAQTGLTDLSQRRMRSLSGGQQQRAWIAMVLAQDAGILLLDEPINHLDLNHQVEIMDLLVDLRLQGKTLIVVLHDLNLASRYADRLVLMKQGALIAEGQASQVLTETHIFDAYQQPVAVMTDPLYGGPLVIPKGRHHRPTLHLQTEKRHQAG